MTLIDQNVAAIPHCDSVQVEVTASDGLLPYLKRNMLCFLTGAAIFGLGWGIAQVPTNPLLIKKLDVGNTFFGIIGTLTGIFSIVGPIIAPAISCKYVRKKWLFFILHQGYVVAPGLIGLSVLFCTRFTCINFLPFFIMVFMLQWNCVPSLFQIPKAEYIAHTISKPYLGRYYGLDGSIAPVISLIGTFLAGHFLAGNPSLNVYAYCLLLGYCIAQIGGILYLFAHECPEIREKSPQSVSFNAIFSHCYRDTDYRPFLVFVFLLCILRAPFNFVPLYGFKTLGMPSSSQAVFIIVISLAQFLSAGPSGWLCDKWGSGKTLAIGLALQIITIVPLCFFRNAFGVYVYLGVDAASMMVTQVASMAYVLRYAPLEKRGIYVAAYWMIQAVAAIIVTTPFALMLDKLSYTIVFWLWSILHIFVLLLVLEANRRGITAKMFQELKKNRF